MAAGRGLASLGRRRERGGDDDEEDDRQLLADDSQSEISVVTGADDQEVVKGEDDETRVVQDSQESTSQQSHINGNKRNGKTRKQGSKPREDNRPAVPDTKASLAFKNSTDTEAMLNGLSISDTVTDDVIDYNASGAEAKIKSRTGTANGEQSRQRREHEEYKKKRDADPAFIPNRGNFFMHDTRGQQNGGPAPFHGNSSGRGRGRGGLNDTHGSLGGGFGRGDKTAGQVWKHDLHSSINEEPTAVSAPSQGTSHTQPQKQNNDSRPGPLSFSSNQTLGRIQLCVLLPGMKQPIVYSEVPAVKYVRLPDHRPPLRRDKPVRIFLPGLGPRYIFPSTERSFIFIPRQMRPNNRGFANVQQRSIGGYGYSSRRTSMYGGSIYSASVAPSRRSSITRDRENMFSPASYVSGYQPPHRPVVRLPHNGHYYASSTPPLYPYSGQHTPTGQIHTYPLPQQPAFQGTPTTTVQHPRPQKAISVSGIESPAMLSMQQPPMDSHAFHGQLPNAMGHHSAHPSQGSIGYDFPQPQFAYPAGVAATGSPLTRIPENQAHANSFPPPSAQQQMYYPPYSGGQQGYYYPQMQMPMQMFSYPPVQQQYTPSMSSGTQDAQPIPTAQSIDVTAGSSQPNTGMVAHESNGMVFYMSAGEAASQPNPTEQFQPAEGFVPSYAAAGMPTPQVSDQGVYYYAGMPAVTNNMNYYPPMQQS